MSSCQLLAVAMLAVAPLLHNQLYSFPFLWLPPSPAPHSLSLTFPLYRFPLHQRLFSRSYTIRDCAMPRYLLANKNKTLFPFLCQLCDGREMGSDGSRPSPPHGLPVCRVWMRRRWRCLPLPSSEHSTRSWTWCLLLRIRSFIKRSFYPNRTHFQTILYYGGTTLFHLGVSISYLRK